MYRGKHFITPEDMMLMIGTPNRSTAHYRFKAICEAIKPGKRSLTIREFCRFESLDYQEVWEMLRPKIPFK